MKKIKIIAAKFTNEMCLLSLHPNAHKGFYSQKKKQFSVVTKLSYFNCWTIAEWSKASDLHSDHGQGPEYESWHGTDGKLS